MKIRYWMVVYPWHMNGGEMKPYPTDRPYPVGDEGKVVWFDVEVPDNLFGGAQVRAGAVHEEPAT